MIRKLISSTGLCAGAIVASLGAISCTGVVEGGGPTDAMANTGGAATGGASGSSGSVSTTNTPTYKAIHRLNRAEYNATVADVLSTSLQPATGSWIDGQTHGFDNIADVQQVDTDQYQRYFDAAGILAEDVFGKPELMGKVVTCATPDEACVDSVVGKLGLRLFRRPLFAEELAIYKKVYAAATQQGEGHTGSLKQVLRAFLSSSAFLYRVEFDSNPNAVEKHPLSPYELATRLSYFFWSSAPDDALLSAAADSSILQDSAITAAVDRLIADPTRGPRFVRNFYGQWLGAQRVESHAVAPLVYPAWSPQLATALADEMYAYFSEFLHQDRSWLTFLTEDLNFVTPELAELYDMPALEGDGLQRVQFTGDARRGFLGLGGFLAQSSLDRRTSPTLRGRWIMVNLLCSEPPPPPQDVPDIAVVAGTTDLSKGNVRAVLEEHRKNPACATCHKLFDPWGIPLEHFDGIGAFRTTYGDGSPIATDTELSDGTFVTTADQMIDKLSQEPRFKQCVADNLFLYGMGRVVSEKDRPTLDAIQAQWNNGSDVPSLRRLLHSIVLADAFRSRSGYAAP